MRNLLGNAEHWLGVEAVLRIGIIRWHSLLIFAIRNSPHYGSNLLLFGIH